MNDAPVSASDRSLDSERTMRGDVPAPARRLRPGDMLLDRYTVLSELGEGGMGVVCKCLDKVGGIEVAVKCLPPELSRNAGEMEGIRENYAIVAKLHHSAISGLRQLERDPATGEYYLVMDLAEGEDLSAILRRRRGRPMPLEEALEILRPLAAALDYAHGEKVLHRDVKPANVKVLVTGGSDPATTGPCDHPTAVRVQLLDFGLAAEIRSSMSRVSVRGHAGTSGTPSYMAPEQWEARKPDFRTDQYALAVMAYQMLSGFLPFEADDTDLLRRAVLSRAPDPIDGLSSAANAALLRALAKNPKDRFPTCAAFVASLARGAGGETDSAEGAAAGGAGVPPADLSHAESAEFGRALPPGAPPDGGRARSPSAPQGRDAPTADEESALFTQKIALGEAISGLSDAVRSDSDTGPHAAACARAFAAGEEALKNARFSAAARCFEQAQAALDRLSDIEKRRREAAERAEAQFARFRRAEVVPGKESPPPPRAKGLRWAAGLCVCGALLYCLADLVDDLFYGTRRLDYLFADVFLVAAFILWWRRGRAGERTMGVLLFLSLVLGFLSPVLGFGLYGGIVHEFGTGVSFCGMMLFAVFAVCLIGRWRIRLAAVVGLIGLCLCNRHSLFRFYWILVFRDLPTSFWGFCGSGTILLAAGLALRAFLHDEPRTAKESDCQGGAIPPSE